MWGGTAATFPDPDESEGRSGCFLILLVLLVGLAAAVVVGAIVFYPVIFVSRWPSLADSIKPWPIRALVVLGMCAFGALLYYARRYLRLYYGIFECCVGAATLWASVSNAKVDRFALSLGLMGGIYVIVRGLDNIAQANAPKDVTVGRFKITESEGALLVVDSTDDKAVPQRIALTPTETKK